MPAVSIEYFAQLRDERGVPRETVDTTAATASALYEELARLHGFSLPCELLRVAVNQQFAPWSTQIKTGDHLVFIPPVSGG